MDIERIKKLYLNKTKLKDIAIDQNTTVDRIRTILKKNNLWKPSKPFRCILNEKQIIEDYKNDIPIEQIALKHNVSTGPIVKILEKHNVRKPNKFKMLSYKHYEYVIDKQNFLKLVDELITQKNIAEYLNCGIDMVVSLFKHHNIPTHNSTTSILKIKQKNAEIPLTKQNVEYLHYQQNLPLYIIAEKTNVSVSFLRKFCKQHDIKIQGSSNIKLSKQFKQLIQSENLHEVLKNEINNSTLKDLCFKYDVNPTTFNNLLKQHNLMIPVKYRSSAEIEIEEYIRSILPFHEVLICDKKTIYPNELDIFIPEKRLAIEFCGLYWHSDAVISDKNYHLNKLIKCINNGIRLITIFEDEWKNKNLLVKNKIAHILNTNYIDTKFIHARNCIIKQLDSKSKNIFLEEFHIQGADKANISLGLFYNDVLVAVMTFSKPSHLKGGKNKMNSKDSWELNRFATHSKYIIRGAAGKLLKHFQKNFSWNHIYSYADRRWSNGDMYLKLGFNLTSYSKPNYWYVLPHKTQRFYRYNFKKSILVEQGYDSSQTEFEIMKSRGYYKIWDCGTIRFDLFKT